MGRVDRVKKWIKCTEDEVIIKTFRVRRKKDIGLFNNEKQCDQKINIPDGMVFRRHGAIMPKF